MDKPLASYLIDLPRDVRVAPVPEDFRFRLTDCELALFDSVAAEHTGVVGVEIDYWSLVVSGSVRDPLYDEPVARKHKGPFRLKGFVTLPSDDPQPGLEGWQENFGGEAWVARKTLEQWKVPSPGEGDIVRFWNIPFFNSLAVDGYDVPGKAYAFNVIDVDPDGVLHDTGTFVGFRLTFARGTKATPERRIDNSV